MWGGGVLSLVRQGLRLRRRPRRRTSTARVVDESALGGEAADATGAVVPGAPVPAHAHAAASGAKQLARAVLAMARGAVVRLDVGEGGRGAVEAWAAASGWRPARAADEVGHLMVRESLRYVIYA